MYCGARYFLHDAYIFLPNYSTPYEERNPHSLPLRRESPFGSRAAICSADERFVRFRSICRVTNEAKGFADGILTL